MDINNFLFKILNQHDIIFLDLHGAGKDLINYLNSQNLSKISEVEKVFKQRLEFTANNGLNNSLASLIDQKNIIFLDHLESYTNVCSIISKNLTHVDVVYSSLFFNNEAYYRSFKQRKDVFKKCKKKQLKNGKNKCVFYHEPHNRDQSLPIITFAPEGFYYNGAIDNNIEKVFFKLTDSHTFEVE